MYSFPASRCDVVRVHDVVDDLFGVQPGDEPARAFVAEVGAEATGRRHVIHDRRHHVGERRGELPRPAPGAAAAGSRPARRGCPRRGPPSRPRRSTTTSQSMLATCRRQPDPVAGSVIAADELRVLEHPPALARDAAARRLAVEMAVDVPVARAEQPARQVVDCGGPGSAADRSAGRGRDSRSRRAPAGGRRFARTPRDRRRRCPRRRYPLRVISKRARALEVARRSACSRPGSRWPAGRGTGSR